MIQFAIVTFTLDRPCTATLTDAGWQCPESATMARILDLDSPLSKFGPADGDPVACAARSAAKLTAGTVAWIRTPAYDPPGTVY